MEKIRIYDYPIGTRIDEVYIFDTGKLFEDTEKKFNGMEMIGYNKKEDKFYSISEFCDLLCLITNKLFVFKLDIPREKFDKPCIRLFFDKPIMFNSICYTAIANEYKEDK